MAFTGKATYSSQGLELAEDVSDLVGIISPHETALLDALGDPARPARSTVHEWLEDSLLPITDAVDDDAIADPATDTTFGVAAAETFRVGDQIRLEGFEEIMLVSEVDLPNQQVTVVRQYGSSPAGELSDGARIQIVGNAALEGADASAARFTVRQRQSNYTQIFSATVEVSGSELAVRQVGVADELDYQKQQRMRELLRELENSVINGRAAAATPAGTSTVRRTMRGIVAFISTHRFVPGVGGFPAGTALTEAQLNAALRQVWSESSGNVDLIVVGGREKRAINTFVSANRRFTAESETFRDAISVYESDFGVCRIVLSRWVPEGTVLLLDSSRIEVMPLSGRSFQYKALARTGDRECGQVIGEYTLQMRNEAAHAMISGLTT